MSRRHSSSQPGNTGARYRKRMVGTTGAVGAFLAFGMAPITAAPTAHADGDFLGDLIGDLVDSWSTPDGGWDFDALFDPGSAAGDTFSMTTFIDQWFYEPLHTGIQAWITSDFGQMVDGWINDISGLYLIGNGVDGDAINPDGGDGGLLFGDGGDGWDSDAAGTDGEIGSTHV